MAGEFLFNLNALWPTSAQVCLVLDLLSINWLHLLDSRVQKMIGWECFAYGISMEECMPALCRVLKYTQQNGGWGMNQEMPKKQLSVLCPHMLLLWFNQTSRLL